MECWDPRDRNRVGVLDCALSSVSEGSQYVTGCPTEAFYRQSYVYGMILGRDAGFYVCRLYDDNMPLCLSSGSFYLHYSSCSYLVLLSWSGLLLAAVAS